MCTQNCSGHGECKLGLCLCQINYSGDSCENPNKGYFIAFGALFIFLGLVALAQLFFCIKCEYDREERASVRSACGLTIQKVLYALTVCAAAIRGAYFFTKWIPSPIVESSLMSAYYPFLITVFSLLVCFWAEVFHINSVAENIPRFLCKSTIAFITFNAVIYLLLVVQLAVMMQTTAEQSAIVVKVFNALFACVMFIETIFFLAYGVEMYFKIHGAFRQSNEKLDWMQLQMSRLGLVAQGTLQLVTALFLASYVLKGVWSPRLAVLGQNIYDIGFHIAEFGVILWFPCVLWNYKSPDELWVLNPKRLFKNLEIGTRETDPLIRGQPSYESITNSENSECWICYENRPDPLIHPCSCRGDVGAVHHECLRKWLVQSVGEAEFPKCKVCNEKYNIEERPLWLYRGLTSRHWFKTFGSLIVLFGCPFAAYAIYHSVIHAPIQALAIGTSVLIQLACLKILGQNAMDAYRRARLVGVRIHDKSSSSRHSLIVPPRTTPFV